MHSAYDVIDVNSLKLGLINSQLANSSLIIILPTVVGVLEWFSEKRICQFRRNESVKIVRVNFGTFHAFVWSEQMEFFDNCNC